MRSSVSEQFAGLAHWNIDLTAAQQVPFKATAAALDAAAKREQGNWPERLQLGVQELAQEMRHFLNAQEHSERAFPPAQQMRLIAAQIDRRTGFFSRFALERPPEKVAVPLRPPRAEFTQMAPAHRNAILQVETQLDRLAADFLQLSNKNSDSPPLANPSAKPVTPLL